jgi:hypothetical protein
MNEQERNLIEGLFQRLQQAETQAGPRDAEAERLIHDLMTRQPAAPYLLAQVVLVQEQGLRNLQGRIEELERTLAERPQAQGSGFLGGLFGGGRPQPANQAPPQPAAGTGWSNSRLPAQGAAIMQPGMQPGMQRGMQAGAQGGGFMAGAMQTAMGVAGGMLLANAVSGLFGDEAQAAEPQAGPQAEPAAAAPEEPDGPGGDEGGGFFDDFFGGDEGEY